MSVSTGKGRSEIDPYAAIRRQDGICFNSGDTRPPPTPRFAPHAARREGHHTRRACAAMALRIRLGQEQSVKPEQL
jgi:hypothetical protein